MTRARRPIAVCVSASVALHRALDLVSELRKREHSVTVLMTPAATKLITPLLFAAISGRRVVHELFGGSEDDVYDHLTPAREAELMVFAPATADLIGRLAAGLADDVVTTTALAYRGPRLLCPAMNWRMWAHPFVQRNVATLVAAGYDLVPPADGDLACGESGPGRLAPVATILDRIAAVAPTL